MGAECCKSRKTSSVDQDTDTALLKTGSFQQDNITPINNINGNKDDDTQQLLSHKTSNNNPHNLSYLSMGSSPNKPDDDDHYKFPQTPPIIKALFGNDEEVKDESTEHRNIANVGTVHNETPMGLGGDVYLGFASNDGVLFEREHRKSINECIDIDNIDNVRPSGSMSSTSSSSSDSDWTSTPTKSLNNPLLMGFAHKNESIVFNPLTPKDVDAALACKDERNPFTMSNMSLNSAHLADIVINGVKRSSSFKSFLMPSKQHIPWIIATFNVFIEYFPYKHIMTEIFLFCNIDINALDFEYPNTQDLENKYNYYDTPLLFIENVSITDKHQPSLVLMIGAPGSGKTSYAKYRYGSQYVIAADDYFDIHHKGQFIGAEVKEAHIYCQQQVLARLHKGETVVVANTHSTYWQLYDKIIPVLFDSTLRHKIVFAVMPETNPTTLVRRCVHSCTKPKIIEYVQSIRYMLSGDGVISTDKVLKYGDTESDDIECRMEKKKNKFDWGLWIEAEGYRSVQDWYQHYTNSNLCGDIGDGRISPIIEDTWPIFKKTFKKWIDLSKFDSENDPVIDLEVRIIGYAKHRISQMVAVEIIKPSFDDDDDDDKKIFWRTFETQINMDEMGCVLSMRNNIPFNIAKYLFQYNCIQYINDGPIVKAKLATKRYVRNYIQYYTPPPLIHPIMKRNSSNNMFFNLEGVISSNAKAVIDKSAFSLKLREKHCNHNAKLAAKENENKHLNPNAKEFKMESKSDTLNPTAIAFEPQIPFGMINNAPIIQTQWFPPPAMDINFMLQQQQLLLQCIQPIPTQNIQSNNVWNNDESMNDTILNPTANEFMPSIQSNGFAAKVLQQENNSNLHQNEVIDYSKMAAYADMEPTHYPQQVQAPPQPQMIHNNGALYVNAVPLVPNVAPPHSNGTVNQFPLNNINNNNDNDDDTAIV